MVIVDKDVDKLIKKLKVEIAIRIIVSSIVFLVTTILIFIFQRRVYQIIYVVLLNVLFTLFFAYTLFVLTQYIRKVSSYENFIKNSRHSSKLMNDILVLKKEKNSPVFGIETKTYSVIEVDTERLFYLHIDEFHKDELEANKKYQVVSYHGIIMEYEEKIDNAEAK